MNFEPTVCDQYQLDQILKDISLRGTTMDFQWSFKSRPVNELSNFNLSTTQAQPSELFEIGALKAFTYLPTADHLRRAYGLNLETKQTGWFVWVEFQRPDANSGQVGIGKGRQEFVAVGASESSVVKTCWLLLELMVRHELMESFHYKGSRLFNPHHTVAELAAIRPPERPAVALEEDDCDEYAFGYGDD